MKKAKVALARKLAVIMHRMLVDGSRSTLPPAARDRRRDRQFLGQVSTPVFPEAKSLAGTMDQVRLQSAQWHCDHASVDRSAYPLSTPSGGGLAPTPDRSECPANG
jgi:hypothetical protein